MLLALLTDLHANQEALSACLAHAHKQGANQYAFLGDLVGYGANPAWVMQTVMQYADQGAWVLLGNHDAGILQADRSNMHPVARQALAWSRAQLSSEQMDFLSSLPLKIEHEDILFVHANAWAPDMWEYVDGVMEAMRSMHACLANITFCGHVHLPMLYHMTATGKGGNFLPAPEYSIPLNKQRRWLAIPGSVGQPRDGNNAACYALYDSVRHELTYFRVPYDHEGAARKILDAGLPGILAQRLMSGN